MATKKKSKASGAVLFPELAIKEKTKKPSKKAPPKKVAEKTKAKESPKPKSDFVKYVGKEAAKTTSDSGDKAPHVIVIARAGTGKTTTLVEGLKVLRGLDPFIKPSTQQKAVWDQLTLSKNARTVCFCAFNRSIAAELKQRIPIGCEAMTTHGLGFRTIGKVYGYRLNVTETRVTDILCEFYGCDKWQLMRERMEVLQATEALVGLSKINLLGIGFDVQGNRRDWIGFNDQSALWQLASYYDVDLNGHAEEVFELVPRVMERCLDVARDNTIDYNDMVWLPIALNLSPNYYDLLLVDEAQDLNLAQQTLVKRAGNRLLFCGDPKQAIYGFAGADAESMGRLAKDLKTTYRGCIELPLTVTRRCGKAIVAEAKRYVPDFEAYRTNPEGKVSRALYRSQSKEAVATADDYEERHGTGQTAEAELTYHSQVEAGDMVLSRTNAPLVSQCFHFLCEGRKAEIQGRDIGKGLIATINKQKAISLTDLQVKLQAWLDNEEAKERSKKNPSENRLLGLQDRYACLLCFIDQADTIQEVIELIQNIFTDSKDSPGIKLSSVHKAKGLEAERVFILMPKESPMPHPMARSAWEREQEYNLLYVAITRAIQELVYVS